MRSKGHSFGAAAWVVLTTAGVALVATQYFGRRRRAPIAEDTSDIVDANQLVDETLEDSFPASDPPAWPSPRLHRH